jgi:hypothetical protein
MFNRVPSEDAVALTSQFDGPYGSVGGSQRGSMVLYRLAGQEGSGSEHMLLPPKHSFRDSTASSERDSIFSISSDSKYPGQLMGSRQGLVPYVYDPEIDDKGPPDAEDRLHDPDGKLRGKGGFGVRGLLNIGVLMLVVFGLLGLFAFYPIFSFFRNKAWHNAIDGNIRVNGTGQVAVLYVPPSYSPAKFV